jgi:phosphate-selective porin OprO/OprP
MVRLVASAFSKRGLANIVFMLLVACLSFSLDPSLATARVYDIVENDTLDFDFSTRKGLRFRWREPDVRLRLGGRLHTDAVFTDPDRTNLQRSDADLRRARLYLDARILKDFRFKVDREFAPDRRGWRNVFAGYSISKSTSLRAGNFVAPFGLEDIVASNHSTFMERASSSALAPSFQTGVMIRSNGRFGKRKTRQRWTLAGAFTSESFGQTSYDRHASEHLGFVGRATWAPIARKRAVLHFGSAFEYRDVRGRDEFRVSSKPESGLLPTAISTGRLANVDQTFAVGGEFLALRGPLTLQAEYVHMFVEREAGLEDVEFQGGYGQVSYVLTGERRRYSAALGTLGGVRPKSAWGAVEIGLRYSVLDLNDGNVEGGRLRDWTVGANWYIRENVRVSANYVAVDADLRTTGQSDSPHVFQMRFQLYF